MICTNLKQGILLTDIQQKSTTQATKLTYNIHTTCKHIYMWSKPKLGHKKSRKIIKQETTNERTHETTIYVVRQSANWVQPLLTLVFHRVLNKESAKYIGCCIQRKNIYPVVYITNYRNTQKHQVEVNPVIVTRVASQTESGFP